MSHRCRAFSLATSKRCAASFRTWLLSRTAYSLVRSSSSLGTLTTIVRSAGLWKCALLSKNFLFSRCSPLANHASTEHEIEAFQWWRSRKHAARVLWCQLAHSLGFLRNQPCSDERIRGIILVRVDPSCADGFQLRFVQVTPPWKKLQFAHEHQLFLDGAATSLGSSGNPVTS